MSGKLEVVESTNEVSPPQPIRFHLCLNVSSLDRSIEFFSAFFGCKPAKHRADYAKFEVEQPPLVLSLEPSRPNGIGVLNHVGLRMRSVSQLVEMQRRLETLGIKTQREDGVECCYARQTKFWLNDPDGTLWEVYTLDEDIDHHGYPGQRSADNTSTLASSSLETTSLGSTLSNAPLAIWSHRLGQPFPASLFVLPSTVDEIRLQGTFNATATKEQRQQLLDQCRVALKPSGTVALHQLTSDKTIRPEQLELPGLAAAVEQVLPIHELISELENAGFCSITFTKFAPQPCFVRQGIELRETLLSARVLPPAQKSSATTQVMYKGSASQIVINGFTLQQGRFTEVSESFAQDLLAVLGNDLIVQD